jgi:pyrroloquinoline quinone biosynthesis protein D
MLKEEDHRLPIAAGDRPRLAAKARLTTDKLTGQPVLLFPENVLLLNPTAAGILELCDGQQTAAMLVSKLGDHYEVARDLLLRDVVEFLERLRWRGLIYVSTSETDDT